MLDSEKQIDQFLGKLKERIMTAAVSPDGQRCINVMGKLFQEFSYPDSPSYGLNNGNEEFFNISSAKTEITISIMHQGYIDNHV